MKLKICGMKHPSNVSAVARLKPDYLGFIFYEKSPRYVPDTLPPETVLALPATIRRVGVFVDAATEHMQQMGERYGLTTLQLHGLEPPDQCEALRQAGYEIIKVFGLDAGFDYRKLDLYQPYVDFFLFDTPTRQHGGSGRTFDWSRLSHYSGDTPFFLSGGIGLNNLALALRLNHPNLAGFDVNSRFETAPGQKSVYQLEQLIERLGR